MSGVPELIRLRRENDQLRGLIANSEMNCIYCELPKAEMMRCESGFPGCARADDIMLADQERSG